jgi:hypothetical protein
MSTMADVTTSEPLIMEFDPNAVLEIRVRQKSVEWSKVDPWIFRSWTGQRRVNGVLYSGPSYYLGRNEVAK